MRKVQTLTVSIALCLALLFAATAKADPITGVELNDSFAAASTNALNYANGSLPYVLFISNAVGSVTLEFHNNSGFNAYFERRIDGVVAYHHPVPVLHYNADIVPDPNYVYPYFSLSTGGVVQNTYSASDMVEIRFAFGPEGDWRFDWTAFKAVPAGVPEPGTLILLGSGLLGLALTSARKKFRK